MRKYWWIGSAVLVMLMLLAQTPGDPTQVTAQDPSATPVVAGDYVGSVVLRGVLRGYLLHIPPDYDGTTPMPLVLSYHGFTGDPIQNAAGTGFSQKADEARFIVAYPAGQRQPMGWYTQPDAEARGWLDDVAFTVDLINKLTGQLNIDSNRIYLAGFSNGGGMVHRLACDLSEQVAAFAPVAGPQFIGDPCDISRPVPMIAFYGRLDNITKYEGYFTLLMAIPDWAQGWADRNGCDPGPEVTTLVENVTQEHWLNCDEGADVILRTYEQEGHAWPDDATDLIWDFFEAHPRPSPENELDEGE